MQIRRLLQSTKGSVAPTVALSLVGLVAAGGIAFDYARLASMDTELQNAADQAALAAATFTAKYPAIGTDSTAEAVGNTGLGTEVSRHTGTVTYTSGGIFEVVATFATGSGTGAIVEYGLYSSSTGGTLISRDTESAINKGANDTLTITYQLTFS